ncbi:MAG: hypothetical protein ABIO71_03710 [Caldimonas sp.]
MDGLVGICLTAQLSEHRLFWQEAGFYIGSTETRKNPMELNSLAFNPFAMLTSPEAVFAALEHSDRLARLKSTICRPLDKPRPEAPAVEVRAFDDAIEAVELPDDFGTA